jgi:AraC-like DNA-binding protein
VTPSSLGASPIQNILLATRIVRNDPQFVFTASSLPGHLLHFMIRGRVRQQCNGRSYDLKPGDVLWYHEDEFVEGKVLEAPWELYSVNFIAPALPPPADDARLFAPAPVRAEEYFAALHADWHDERLAPGARLLRSHAQLLLLLETLTSMRTNASALNSLGDSAAQLWWQLETAVRRDLSAATSLKHLEEWSGSSAATIARACQLAVHTSPMRRIKQIRLSFARGLVRLSDSTFSEIALQVGYQRVHEFSRDYRRAFGIPPSEDRKRSSSLDKI